MSITYAILAISGFIGTIIAYYEIDDARAAQSDQLHLRRQ